MRGARSKVRLVLSLCLAFSYDPNGAFPQIPHAPKPRTRMAIAVSNQIGRSDNPYFASQSLLSLKQDELSPALRNDDRGAHYGSGLVVAKIEARVGRNAEKGQGLATRGAGGEEK